MSCLSVQILADLQFSTAFVCAIVGIVDSIVAARENGTKYGYPVGPNRELVALGAANLTSSLFVHTGCVPVFGSVTREFRCYRCSPHCLRAGSRLNGSTGGRTQMSSIITGILIVLSIFFLLPWLYFLPKVCPSSSSNAHARLSLLRSWCSSYMPVSFTQSVRPMSLIFSSGRSTA